MDYNALIEGIVKSLTTMIGALGWPAAAFGIAWLFKEKLNELLPTLNFKHKDWEVSFKLAEKLVEELPKQEPSAEVVKKSAEEEEQLEEIAESSPKAAIISASQRVQLAVGRLADIAGIERITGMGWPGYTNLVINLQGAGLVDVATMQILFELRFIREVTAKGREPTEDEARRYSALALKVLRELDTARQKLKRQGTKQGYGPSAKGGPGQHA
jgi:hypothetical protein